MTKKGFLKRCFILFSEYRHNLSNLKQYFRKA